MSFLRSPSGVIPYLPITSPRTLRNCSSLPLERGDVFITSYPKSGTTWTQWIVLSLILTAKQQSTDNSSSRDPIVIDHVGDYAPFYEIDPHWDATGTQMTADIQQRQQHLGRRVFNTHLRFELLPHLQSATSDKAALNSTAMSGPKFIYLVRHPLDTCLSFYHHLSSQGEGTYTKSFGHFFDEWMNGTIYFGSWLDHLLSYAKGVANGEKDVLVLEYERMVHDLPRCVNQICRHLELELTDEIIEDELLPTFSFSYMKSHKSKFQPRSVGWLHQYEFLRKGIVGDSTSKDGLVTQAMRDAFRQRVEESDYTKRIQDIFAGSEFQEEAEIFLKVVRI